MLYKIIPLFIFIGLFTWTKVNAISTEDKEILIALHKAARDEIESSNMKNIKWDNDIAKGAETYAKECHDLKNSDTYLGELQGGDSSGNVTVIFNKWYSQKEDFEKCNCRSNLKYIYNKKSIGQYAQIIYALYDKFGCGKATCDNLSYKYLLVCRYSSGIRPGATVYKLPVTPTTPTPTPDNSDMTTSTSINDNSSAMTPSSVIVSTSENTTDAAKTVENPTPDSTINNDSTPSNTNSDTKTPTSSEETGGVKDIIFNNNIFNRIIFLFFLVIYYSLII